MKIKLNIGTRILYKSQHSVIGLFMDVYTFEPPDSQEEGNALCNVNLVGRRETGGLKLLENCPTP